MFICTAFSDLAQTEWLESLYIFKINSTQALTRFEILFRYRSIWYKRRVEEGKISSVHAWPALRLQTTPCEPAIWLVLFLINACSHFTVKLKFDLFIILFCVNRYVKYNPELSFGFDCCSDRSISFHYAKAETMKNLHTYIYLCKRRVNSQ